MSYWSKRQEELNKALEKDEAKLKKRLAKMYAEESRRLERQIAAYYEMYGEDDVIAYRKLLEDLSEEDKRLLMEEMDDFAEKYPEYRDLMPIRESVYNLDRLEGLQYSVQIQQLRIGAKEQDMIKQHLIENAYRSANAAAEAMGFGTKFYSMNSNIMSRFVGVPWADGRSFSDRIWDNKKKLTNYLSRDLAQGMARGDSYEQLVKNITERFGKVSKNDAYRLVYTEGTYVMAESSMMPFEEDFQFYKLSTVGDDKVCSICRGLENGEPMPIEKRVPGENFPPLHPWCRCTFTIEVEDWDKWMDDYVAKYGQSTADEAGRIADRIDPKRNRAKYSKARPIHTESDLLEVSDSSIINMQSYDEVTRYFAGTHGIPISGFEGKDLFDVKATLAGVDDAIKRLPEIEIKSVKYNPRLGGFGALDEYGNIEIASKGLKSYGTGVHEAVHAYDRIYNVSDDIVVQARRNLKLRVNSRAYENLVYNMTGSLKYVKNNKELLAYAVETEMGKGKSSNILSKEIFRLLEERI